MEGQEELLVFDFEDLVNGIGGALGLFLGWSFLHLGRTKITKRTIVIFLILHFFSY